MTYLIADTHYNHDKMLDYRPKGWEAILADNWNKIVKPEDTVIHLGDVIFRRQSELKTILGGLNGVKILVKGNHDTKPPAWYQKAGFSLVCSRLELSNKIVLTHEPLKRFNGVNIHGHNHGAPKIQSITDRITVNIVPYTDKLKPVSLEKLLKKLKKERYL